MLSKLKNWWFVIVTVILAILDSGFDVINPALELLNLPDWVLNLVKFSCLIFAIVKTKLEPPTKNPIKLQEVVDKMSDPPKDGGGKVVPPDAP